VRLEDIGFYTLSDARARQTSATAPLSRCELVLTDRCNLHCPYCRGLKTEYRGDMPWHEAAYIITQWQKNNLRNIRFSGGEPTLYRGFTELVSLAAKSCKRIAISTNGTAPFALYEELIKRGANDFSVSLDACCSNTCDKMTGVSGKFEKITENIKHLANRTYTTVGIVVTPDNIKEAEYIISVAQGLGVHDVRIISAAQWKPGLDIPIINDAGLPILRYRLNNMRNGRPIRGLAKTDSQKCFLALDDMAVVGKHHYPCIIYMRERGDPIGEFTTIEEVREARAAWVDSHDCYNDYTCRNNCLDVCVDYNTTAREVK
jgi:pyruvate-formate lyase-activating enzyme